MASRLTATDMDSRCPTCGAHLARTSRRWFTCVECWDCRLYPADELNWWGGNVRPDREPLPPRDMDVAISRFNRLTVLDRAHVLVELLRGRADGEVIAAVKEILAAEYVRNRRKIRAACKMLGELA